MGFDSLLGNERLKENLRSSIRRGHISHFYLISGPEGSGKHTLARLLAAAMVCQGDGKPCLRCQPCRKVMEGLHPDVICVDDPEKSTVSVELIRNARADVYIQPNEAQYKIYLFPRAQDMGLPGQNALLKVLEEPPEYGVFLLLVDNPNRLLPTVRSRCVELALQALPEPVLRQALAERFPTASGDAIAAAIAASGGYLGQAQTILAEGSAVSPQTERFAQALAARDSLALLEVLAPMEKWKRDPLYSQLRDDLALVENALLCRSGLPPLSPAAKELSHRRGADELLAAVRCLQKAMEYTQSNVSPAAVCGYLEWALR